MDRDSSSTSSWEYVDFELETRKGGPRGYPADGGRSPQVWGNRMWSERNGVKRKPSETWWCDNDEDSLQVNKTIL